MSFGYAACLLASIAGMLLVDRRFRLVFWHAPARAAVLVATGVAFFLAWDLAGIGLGIFFRGETAFMTGILIAPELPIEEPVFLAFLSHLALLAYAAALRLAARRARARAPHLAPRRAEADR